MTGEYVLWFDPRSSNSKRTLDLLRRRGIEPVIRRFLEESPSPAELKDLLARLGVPAHAVARTNEDEYHALRLSERTPEGELLAAFSQHPRILDRPIFVAGDRAVVARPPERVLELLGPVDSSGSS